MSNFKDVIYNSAYKTIKRIRGWFNIPKKKEKKRKKKIGMIDLLKIK